MSATTFRSTLNYALLRVVLPGVAMLFGLTFMIRAGFSAHADPLLRATVGLGGGAAGLCGFFTLLWGVRARFSDQAMVRRVAAVRSDMALGSLILVVGLLGLVAASRQLVTDFGPAQTFEARLDHLQTYKARRSGGGASLHLEGRRQPLQWRCSLDCTALDGLRPLQQLEPGTHLEVTTIGGQLVGLTAQGQEFLWSGGERDRLKISAFIMGLLFAATAVGAGVYVRWRYRTGYPPSAANGPDYRVLLQNRLTRDRKVQP